MTKRIEKEIITKKSPLARPSRGWNNDITNTKPKHAAEEAKKTENI
jgi:hypothetical protein